MISQGFRPTAKSGSLQMRHWRSGSKIFTTEGWKDMGKKEQVHNKVQGLKGDLQRAVGKATNDKKLTAEGQANHSSSKLKQASEKVKDAFKK